MRVQPSRLSQLIDSPGGLTVAEALKQAEANLEPLRAPALRRIEEHIAALERFAPADSGAAAETLDQVYARAAAIIDHASPFELDDLCGVATSLCDLVRSATPGGSFDWRVPAVHARAMSLLLTLPVDAADERRRVRTGIASIASQKRSPRG